jgi:N-acetylmuramoyl-L-alanine amidase
MKLFKKITSFTLVLAMLLGAQAAGLDIEGFYASSLSGKVSKNHPGAVLQSIDTEQPNPDYVSLGNGILQRNSTQKVTVGLGLDMTSVGEAGLTYKLEESEQVLMKSSSNIKNGYITFDINVGTDASLGKYSLLDVQLKSKDGSALNSINLKDMAVSYEVVGDKSTAASVKETSEPASAQIPETSAVVGVGSSSSITGEDIGKAIDSARKAMQNETAQPAAFSAQGSEANNVEAAEGVNIVLDPGHGGSEPGAVSGSYLEKNLNLKIAQYTKEELETYAGVTVGMTRTGDTYIPLAATRADAAQQQGADILVSIHNNSAANTAAGSEVYVSVLKAYNQASTVLGNLILDELTMLGLYDRGVKTRSSEDGTIFSLTGELADYYGIIKESAYRGFPGIIIEHGFMSNPEEAQAYLSSDAKLKQLGVADAKALADYYGLVKKDATTTSVNLSAGKLFTSPVLTNLSCMTDGSKSTNSFAEDYPAVRTDGSGSLLRPQRHQAVALLR